MAQSEKYQTVLLCFSESQTRNATKM